MLENLKINYNIKMDFSGLDVEQQSYNEVYNANELWKKNKLRGALFSYNEIISKLIEKDSTMYSDYTYIYDAGTLYYVTMNKVELLKRLFEINGIERNINNYQDIINTFKLTMNKLDELQQTYRVHSFKYDICYELSYMYSQKHFLDNDCKNKYLEKAIFESNQMIKINSTIPYAYFNKAETLYSLNRSNEALEFYELALDLSIEENDLTKTCKFRINEINNPDAIIELLDEYYEL